MTNQKNTDKESKSFGGVAKPFVLLPDQIEWLKAKRLETKRSASLIVRDLIAKAMAEDARPLGNT